MKLKHYQININFIINVLLNSILYHLQQLYHMHLLLSIIVPYWSMKINLNTKFNLLFIHILQLTFNMQVTFMPKKRAHSVNFLQKFKGKVTKIDRYSGILGALQGHSHRYHSIQEQTSIQTGRNIKTIESSKINQRPKGTSNFAIKLNQRQVFPIENILHLNKTRARKFSRPLKTQHDNHDKENHNSINFQQTAFLLPKLNSKSGVNSNCINKRKPTNLTRKQSRICSKDETNPKDVNISNECGY